VSELLTKYGKLREVWQKLLSMFVVEAASSVFVKTTKINGVLLEYIAPITVRELAKIDLFEPPILNRLRKVRDM